MERALKITYIISSFVIILMIACGVNIFLHDGFGHGAGMDVFQNGLSNPWQAFINFDLLSGLLLMVAWIVFRERGGSRLQTFAWVWLVVWWGNIIVALYILVCLYTCGRDWAVFFLGRKASTGQPNALRPFSPPLRAISLILAIGFITMMFKGLLQTEFSGIAAYGYFQGFGSIAFAFLILTLPIGNAAHITKSSL